MEIMEFEDLTVSTFEVDSRRRTMRGLVVPWNGIGRHSNGRKWRFARGSLIYGHEKYIKFNNDHDQSQRFGRAIEAEDTDAGLVVTFKVSAGPAGDRALAMAQDGSKTGLSIEVEIDTMDTESDPDNPGVLLVKMAHLTGVGFVKDPAFNDSRLISVTASANGKDTGMPEETVETQPAEAQPVTFTPEQFSAFLEAHRPATAPEVRATVDPAVTPVPAVTQVTEPLPYAFSRVDTGKYTFSSETEHDFSTDLIEMFDARASGRDYSPQMARLNEFVRATFADVEIADLPGTLTSVRKPEMWVPQRDYATPLWDLTGRGATPEGGRKFDIPKFTSASGLVSVATEKTEPAGGSFVDELQTITPGQLWGKVEITRQVWRQGGNPAFSGILWSQMLRSFFEARETAIATFLATLTAAADIALVGPDASPSDDENQATMASYEQAIGDLQFARGGNRFTAFAVHQSLYRVAVRTKDDSGRPMYPMINPMNANGTTQRRYQTIEVGGTTWVPAYALGTPSDASSNSWLFDPDVVMAWAGTPERLFWDFGATVQTANIPQLSWVTVGLYADYAVANTDITGVRQVTFDPNSAA
jgi:HK97 family phage prohead protease